MDIDRRERADAAASAPLAVAGTECLTFHYQGSTQEVGVSGSQEARNDPSDEFTDGKI